MLARIANHPTWAGLALVTLVGFGLALIGLNARSLWFDEAISVRTAQWPREQFLDFAFEQERFTALYYGFLRGWLRVDDGVLWVRLASALFAAGAVGFTYLIGRRLLDPASAIAGAGLLALHALQLQYAQEARTYALAVLFVTAATWAFLVALERGSRWGWWALYAALVVVAVYAHFYSVMVVVAHAVAFALRPGWRSLPWVHALAAWGVAALASLPLASWLLTNDQTRGWIAAITPARFISVFQWLGGGNAVVDQTTGRFLAATAVAVVVVGVLYGGWALRRRPDERWSWILLLGWVLLPIVGGVIASLVIKPVLADRYLLVVLPGLALVAGGLLARIPWPPARVAAGVAAVAVLLVGTLQVYGTEMKKPAFGEAVAIIAAADRPGDAVITEPGWQWVPLEYALRQADDPPSVARVVTNPAIEDPAATMVRAVAEHPRIWLLVIDGRASPEPDGYAYRDLLEQSYRLVERHEVHRIGVFLYERAS
jgi:mannosyltransferase